MNFQNHGFAIKMKKQASSSTISNTLTYFESAFSFFVPFVETQVFNLLLRKS